MSYTVAQAEVLVLPNAENFGKTLEAQIGTQADAIGRKAGDKIGEQIQERVRLALKELPDAELGLDTTAARAELAKFNAEATVKAKVAGKGIGKATGEGVAEGVGGMSPLIASAIGGVLVAGGPLLVAAGGALMAGLAGVIVHNAPEIQEAANKVGSTFSFYFTEAASSTIPAFTEALNTVKASAKGLAAEAAPAFMAMQQPIQQVTGGVISLAQNAMPGLTRAIQTGGPVFQGLASFLASIGTGISQMFSLLSTHSAAMGTVLSSLGTALQNVFRILGTLLGAGSELGASVLPILSSALGAVATVLQAISPILPEVVAGFVALKTASALSGMLTSLAASLEATGAKAMVAIGGLDGLEAAGMAAGTGFSVAASGARGLEAAMGPIGWILMGVSVAVPLLMSAFGRQTAQQDKTKESAEKLTQALQQSKGAIDDTVRATAAAEAQKDGLFTWAQTWGIASSTVVDALLGVPGAMGQVTKSANEYAESHRGAAAAEKDGTIAGDALSGTYAGLAQASDGALGSITTLSGKVSGEVSNQKALQDAIDGSSGATQTNAQRLQELTNKASVASSQITALKDALDSLTGKAVSMGDAEVAVTNSVTAAKTALDGQKDAAGNLTSKLTDANGALDKHTAAGAAAWSALTQLKDSSNQLISTMEQQGATTDQVAAKDGELRQQFIDTARQMGFSADEANNLANQIYGIPTERHTEIVADTADATNKVNQFNQLVQNLKDKTVSIIARETMPDLNGSASGSGRPGAALGGIAVHRFADGGVYNPMPGNVASIVGPNTWRVIGDRAVDDEAFIPINSDTRSQQILAQTAGRMGFGLTSGHGGAGKTDARAYTFHISAPSDPKAIATEIREAQATLEFLHG